MSKNASSIETCSTNGVSSARTAITCELTARYRSKWPGRPDRLRAEALGLGGGHRGADAERARLVRGRRDHAPLVGRSAHDDGLAAPRGMVQLLDAGKKASRSKSPIAGPSQAPKRPSSKPYVCSHVSMR